MELKTQPNDEECNFKLSRSHNASSLSNVSRFDDIFCFDVDEEGNFKLSRSHNTSSPLLKTSECCKNKECLQCYGGVFKKASPTELASRDIFVQPKSLKKDTDTTCAICLVSFATHKFVWKLSCNHYFHYNCIEKWSDLENYTCPLCRKEYEYP